MQRDTPDLGLADWLRRGGKRADENQIYHFDFPKQFKVKEFVKKSEKIKVKLPPTPNFSGKTRKICEFRIGGNHYFMVEETSQKSSDSGFVVLLASDKKEFRPASICRFFCIQQDYMKDIELRKPKMIKTHKKAKGLETKPTCYRPLGYVEPSSGKLEAESKVVKTKKKKVTGKVGKKKKVPKKRKRDSATPKSKGKKKSKKKSSKKVSE